MRVLVVEDDAKVAGALRTGLTSEGYDVAVATTGEDGYFLVTTEPFDAVLLDIGLPGRSGLEILSGLRRRGLRVPVLLLTARDAIEDRVRGLDTGADDYLVKPFAFAELLARLCALLRRGRSDEALRVRLADLELDRLTRHVRRGSAGGMMGQAGMGAATWQLTQTGSNVAGTVAFAGMHGRTGSFTGMMSGQDMTFTMDMPMNGMMGSDCSARATGTAHMDPATLTLTCTYSGTNSCSGPFTNGQMTMARR